MGNYTPEQVEELADKLEDPSYSVEEMTQYAESAAPHLRAYAAALRQQAGRVDENGIRVIAHFLRSLSSVGEEWRSSNPNNTAVIDLGKLADKLTRALSGEKAGPVGDGWISVDDRLPEPCQFVLASYLNTNGKGRVIRAMYAAPRTLELHMDAEGGEYDEETDTYWCEPGWYEANDNEEIHWFVAEKVTHWMPLPASPTPDKEG